MTVRTLVVALGAATVGALAPAAFAQTEDAASLASYQAHLAAAEKSLRLEESRELRRWLEGAPEARRGWEWRYLSAIADTSAGSAPAPGGPSRITMAPDGTRLATVEQTTVRLRSWPDLEPLGTIEGHADAIYRAEFSPDGRRLVTVARDQTSRVWEIASGREISRIELPNPAFAAATFSPDGALAATCAWEQDEDRKVHGVVWIWDAATGEVRSRQRVGVKPLSAIRFTPDGSRLLAGSWDGLVHVLDADASEIRRLELPREDAYNAVNDIAVSPDGRVVAAGSKDRTVRVFEIETGELVATLRGHQGYIEGVAFSPDGATLASASVDATVRLWNAGDWSPGGTLRGSLDTVRGVAWSADGASLVACSLDSTLRIWDAGARHAPQLDIDAGLEGTYSAALSPDGRTVAVACYDGWLRVFDAATGAEVGAWEAHPGSTCHFAAYSGDGSRLVTCSWDKTARVWDTRSHEEVARLEAGRGVYACAISPDGSRVALTAGGVQIWDVNAAEKLHQAAPDDAAATRVAFSADGALVAAGFDGGQARVYRSGDGQELAALGETGPRVEAVTFTPGGDEVVTGDAAGVVRAFPAAGGPARFACDTGGRSVSHVAVAGNRIAAATDQLWILDLAAGAAVFGRRPHADTIWHLSWSADGARLATCCGNGTIAVLDAPAPAAVAGPAVAGAAVGARK